MMDLFEGSILAAICFGIMALACIALIIGACITIRDIKKRSKSR